MMSMKLIMFYIFVYVNGLNMARIKGMSRYRKSIVLNVANSIQHKSCPLLEHFDNRPKRADDIDVNKKIIWSSISGPWNIEYYDEIDELLMQEGELSMLE